MPWALYYFLQGETENHGDRCILFFINLKLSTHWSGRRSACRSTAFLSPFFTHRRAFQDLSAAPLSVSSHMLKNFRGGGVSLEVSDGIRERGKPTSHFALTNGATLRTLAPRFDSWADKTSQQETRPATEVVINIRRRIKKLEHVSYQSLLW